MHIIAESASTVKHTIISVGRTMCTHTKNLKHRVITVTKLNIAYIKLFRMFAICNWCKSHSKYDNSSCRKETQDSLLKTRVPITYKRNCLQILFSPFSNNNYVTKSEDRSPAMWLKCILKLEERIRISFYCKMSKVWISLFVLHSFAIEFSK